MVSGQAAIFASAIECLRDVLPCKVELAADDGESGRIIISFKDIGELHEVVKHICAARTQRRPRDPVHMSRVEGPSQAPQPRRLWAGRESCGGPGGKAPWLTGTFRVLAEGVVSTPP